MSKKKILFSSNRELLSGLVAYYAFENNANDITGNGNNGTIVGSPTYPTGKKNLGIDFGNDSNFNYVYIPDSNDLSFTDGIKDLPFTISMWVNFTSFNSMGNWLINKRNATSGGDEWQFCYFQNRLQFWKFQFNNNAIYQQIATTTTPFSLNTWYHISYTDDGSGVIGSGKIYINGIDITSLNQNVGGIYSRMNNSNSIVKVGINAWPPLTAGLKHKGLIDEVAIWKNRELNATEISDLYNSGLGKFYNDF